LNLVTDKDETQHWNLPGSKRKEKKNQPVSIVKQRKLKTKKKKKKKKKNKKKKKGEKESTMKSADLHKTKYFSLI
jgi:hypothetical protein